MESLPHGFDPEQHVRRRVEEKPLVEGLNVVQHDPDTGFYLFSKVQRSAAGVVTRCWHCYRRPDGSFDCFEVKCPWNITAPTQSTQRLD
jgi:hypothetical protein